MIFPIWFIDVDVGWMVLSSGFLALVGVLHAAKFTNSQAFARQLQFLLTEVMIFARC
jgi:hypothetical protein